MRKIQAEVIWQVVPALRARSRPTRQRAALMPHAGHGIFEGNESPPVIVSASRLRETIRRSVTMSPAYSGISGSDRTGRPMVSRERDTPRCRPEANHWIIVRRQTWTPEDLPRLLGAQEVCAQFGETAAWSSLRPSRGWSN